MSKRPTFGSVFAGIGGIDLGLERAGWACRWQIEKDEYCQRVLAKHWPDVARYGDVEDVDPDDLERVDLVAGGFPCQPVSAVGERRAEDDTRWLWPDLRRIIRGVRPRFVLVENVTGLFDRGFGTVLGELAEDGFNAEWSVLSACAMGAPHPRERVFIVAYPQGERLEWPRFATYEGSPLLAGERRREGVGGYWASEPRPHGVAYGTPDRVDRLKGHGNAVVPQVAQLLGGWLLKAFNSRRDLGVEAQRVGVVGVGVPDRLGSEPQESEFGFGESDGRHGVAV